MKIKLFVAHEIQYFEVGIFSFNSYVYYLTRGFIASNRAFNLLTRTFNLPTCAFTLPTRAFNLVTRDFSVLTRGFELVTRVLLSHPYTHLYGFWMTLPPFPYLRTYLMDGLFLNQKSNNNIRISYSCEI